MAKKNKKEVAYKDRTIIIENLPFPIVYYPGFYGAFFGFAESETSPIYLCSCSKCAIGNYIRFRLRREPHLNSSSPHTHIMDCMYFPQSLVDELMQLELVEEENVIQKIRFEDELCHECNNVVPSLKYCVEMYGGVFKQNYGWYINKQAYEMGVEPISDHILSDICSNEILELIEYDPKETMQIYQELSQVDFEQANELLKKYQKQTRKVWRVIENRVRLKFNHKKVGDSWTSETILYQIVQTLFPNYTVHRHYRPEYLENMEFDIFIENVNLGIEYQGIQHFEPVGHWGGEEAFEKLLERDARKRKLARLNEVNLVYFEYDQDLNESIVRNKLKQFLT